MVSTRRMARDEPAKEVNDGLSLQKKPLRKTTAKKVASAPKPRTLRNKEPEVDLEETKVGSTSQKETRVANTKSGATKAQRAPAVVNKEVSKGVRAASKVDSKTTRATRSQVQSTKEQKAPDIRTRRVADATQPLSPRKITQVAKTRTRTAVTTAGKPSFSTRTTQVAPDSKSRRRQKESNENADALPTSTQRSVRRGAVGTPSLDLAERAIESTETADSTDIVRLEDVMSPASGLNAESRCDQESCNKANEIETLEDALLPSTQLCSSDLSEPLSTSQSQIVHANDPEKAHSTPFSKRVSGYSSESCSVRDGKPTGSSTPPPAFPLEPTPTVEDPDETIIMDFQDDEQEQECEQDLTENLVQELELTSDIGALALPPAPLSSPIKPQPETLVWESLALEQPILSTPPLHPNASQMPVPCSQALDSGQHGIEISGFGESNATCIFSKTGPNAQEIFGSLSRPTQISPIPESVDASINLTDFIDLHALVDSFRSPEPVSIGKADLASDTFKATTTTPCLLSLPSTHSHGPISTQHAFSIMSTKRRRKSMPVYGRFTPVKAPERPRTADHPSSVVRGKHRWREWRGVPGLLSATSVSSKSSSPQRDAAHVLHASGLPTVSPIRTRESNVSKDTECATPAKLNVQSPNGTVNTCHIGVMSSILPVVSSVNKRFNFQASQTPQASPIQNPAEQECSPNTPFSVSPFKLPLHLRHAATVCAPRRFHTPPKFTPLRPRSHKIKRMQKVAFEAATPPTRVPVKFEASTPVQAPLTPHPSAPLKGIVALVEIYTSEGESASQPFVALLHRLGARTTKSWSDRITHVIFKDGSPKTLQRVHLHNKEADNGSGTRISCVNGRWVSDCDINGAHVDESDELYIVDTNELPRGGKRRRQSMEPAILHSFGGSVLKDRKSSNSLSRTPRSFRSSDHGGSAGVRCSTPENAVSHSPDFVTGDGDSPETPAWLHPENLVQQTAPLKRVRKLEFPRPSKRRLTYWHGDAIHEV